MVGLATRMAGYGMLLFHFQVGLPNPEVWPALLHILSPHVTNVYAYPCACTFQLLFRFDDCISCAETT